MLCRSRPRARDPREIVRMYQVHHVRSDEPVSIHREDCPNGRTSVLDLARVIGDKNDVGGLLGQSPEAFFALAEGVAFGFLQLAEVLLSLEPEKKYQHRARG